jgi:type IV pilus assembly protein PilC
VNQQLAGMLKAGIPLEGALQQLCATMRRGGLRTELEQLEADLARGTPLTEAIQARRLPEFYRAMLRVGAQSHDLPGVLILLADYYQKLNTVWIRLQGLMVYPVIVVLTSLVLFGGLAWLFTQLLAEPNALLTEMFAGSATPAPAPFHIWLQLWGPVVVLGLVAAALLAGLLVPRFRSALKWKLPGFRDASLSQFASALGLMLHQGCDLRAALALLRQLEAGQPLGREAARWQQRLSEGKTRFADVAGSGPLVPPLFIWIVASAGENWVGGFRRAAEVYAARAAQRTEMMLYAALPVSVLLLGGVIVAQVLPVLRLFLQLMDGISGMDGM